MKLRRNALVAGAVAIGLLLSGCVGSYVPQPASSTSKPTGEKVAADLQPFYDQVVHWKSCDSGFQCATAQAPLDWANPSGTTTISLALIRKPATGTSKGALLVNPGGPGASGVDFVKSSLIGRIFDDMDTVPIGHFSRRFNDCAVRSRLQQ